MPRTRQPLPQTDGQTRCPAAVASSTRSPDPQQRDRPSEMTTVRQTIWLVCADPDSWTDLLSCSPPTGSFTLSRTEPHGADSPGPHAIIPTPLRWVGSKTARFSIVRTVTVRQTFWRASRARWPRGIHGRLSGAAASWYQTRRCWKGAVRWLVAMADRSAEEPQSE